MTDVVEVSLSNLQSGAVVELFDRALAEVLGNIRDQNTDPKAVRVIAIRVAFKPTDDQREGALIAAKVSTTLAPAKPVGGQVFIGENTEGRLVAVSYDLRQGDMFRPKADADGVVLPRADVTPITRKAASNA